jgi:hypothetical protein
MHSNCEIESENARRTTLVSLSGNTSMPHGARVRVQAKVKGDNWVQVQVQLSEMCTSK